MSERLQQSTTILATELSDDETVALDPDAARYFGMSQTGPAVWREFVEPSTVAEVIERLEARFGDPDGTIRHDVHTFVEELRSRSLLVPAD